MAYFHFNFRDAKNQGLRGLVRSLITQLSARSTPHRDILYSVYDEGK